MNKSMQNGFHGDENKGPRIFEKSARIKQNNDGVAQDGRMGRGWIASPPPFHYPTWCFISGSLSLSPSCDVLACVTKVLILALFCSSAYQRACRGYVSRGYRVTSSFVEKRQWSERQGLVRHTKKKSLALLVSIDATSGSFPYWRWFSSSSSPALDYFSQSTDSLVAATHKSSTPPFYSSLFGSLWVWLSRPVGFVCFTNRYISAQVRHVQQRK